MKYTISKEADKKIEEDMRIICDELKRRIPNVLSIILSGGFSRGEGPVKIEKNKMYPYNDYDIQVICNFKLDKEEIDKIATEISEKLGYKGIAIFYPFKKEQQKMKDNFYIDLKCDMPKDLKKLLPRIRTYELKNHSLLLFGEDYRNLIPGYNLKDIPLSEGAKLLLDRMSQMVEYYSTTGKYEKEFLTYIIQQAYAACCTALLLLSGRYQIGYKKAMEIFKENYEKDFPELYEKIPDLHKKIEKFVLWKINPKKLPKNVEEEWFIAKNNILEVSKYFFSKFLNKKILSLDDLSKSILGMGKKFYMPFLNGKLEKDFGIKNKIISLLIWPSVPFIFKHKYYNRLSSFGIRKPSLFFARSPDLVIFGSVPFIIGSIDKSNVNMELLKQGKELLNTVYPTKGETWEDISLDYANAYIAFYLQKI